MPDELSDEEVFHRLRCNIPEWNTLSPEVQADYLAKGIALAKQIHQENLKIYLRNAPPEGNA